MLSGMLTLNEHTQTQDYGKICRLLIYPVRHTLKTFNYYISCFLFKFGYYIPNGTTMWYMAKMFFLR